MKKWTRMRFQPCVPLGEDGRLASSCKAHTEFSKKAASEGVVLLKNNGVLPFGRGTKIAVFGKAQVDWINAVQNCIPAKYQITLLDALFEAKKNGEIEIFEELTDFYRNEYKNQKSEIEEYNREAIEIKRSVNDISEPNFPAELANKAAEFADAAVIVICRRGGENNDRKKEAFDLTERERMMIDGVCGRFKRVVAILNIGSQIETDWIKGNDKIGGALLVGYPGMEGGAAVLDVLLGRVNPSGKLVDTYAKKYSDYPSGAYFNISDTRTKYYEDIYVGYRYFETIPGAEKLVNYPFGFGLSYTRFEFSDISAASDGEKIYIKTTVTNVGEVPGKEVVQGYYSAPQGLLGKPARELGAFKKTKLLEPKESQTLELEIKIGDMASYDDVGKCAKSAYVLEKGNYCFYIGNSVRNTQKADFEYVVEDDFRIVEQLTEQSPSIDLEKRMKSDGTFEELPTGTLRCPPYPQRLPIIQPKLFEKRIMLIDVAEGRADMDDFIAQLDREYMIKLLGGKPSRGVSITNGMGGESKFMSRDAGLDEYGVPCAMTCDDPTGISTSPDRGIHTTMFPCPMIMACSWDEDVFSGYGNIGALEMKENNLSIWLSPAINIHRDPLCGRNQEYYSEDPYLTGKLAAAKVRAVQKHGVAATPKHFAANNREFNRHYCDSVVSERALREIYLKAFEICVKEADPWVIMSSYNLINGVRAGENYDLITNVLRGEWGYKGLVTTDWYANSRQGIEISAGNDVKMPYGSYEDATNYLDVFSYNKGMQYIQPCVRRLLELLIKLD